MRNAPKSFREAPRTAPNASRSFTTWVGIVVFVFVLLAATLLVSVAILARMSGGVEKRLTALFISMESHGNHTFRFLKPLFGVELTGTAEELAQQIKARNTAAIQELLDAGVSPDSLDSTGNPAIRLAAEAGFNEGVSLLLSRGAKPDLRALDGSTALLSAIRRNNTALARVLLEKGAKPTVSADDATTPLMVAAQKANLTVCELLLKGGADVSAKNAAGLRALDYAVQAESLAVVELLVRNGASPIEPDGKGESPLLKSVGLKNSALIKALTVRGAGFDTPTPNGRTVREQVFEQGLNILERPDGQIVAVPAALGEMRSGSTEPSAAEIIAATGADEAAPPAAAEPVEEAAPRKKEAKPSPTPAPSSTPLKRLTKLRLVGELEGVWITRSGSLTLAGVTANIRNVGDYVAENVQVSVTVPGGQLVRLTGPTVLQPYEQQQYISKSAGAKVPREGNLKAELSCDNCRGKE